MTREEKAAKQREYYAAHRDYQIEFARRYRANNVQKLKEYRRRAEVRANRLRGSLKWLLEHPEAAKRYRTAKDSNKRAKALGCSGLVTTAQIEARVAMWGGRCWMCGGPYEHIDHVIPLSRKGPNLASNIRPACATCNRRKGFKSFREHSEALEKRLEDREELGRFV